MIYIDEVPNLTKEMSIFPYKRALEKKFEVSSCFGDDISLTRRVGQYLYVPRACCPIGKVDKRTKGSAIDIVCKVIPRDAEQKKNMNMLYKLIRKGESGMFEADTGSGKTVMAIGVLAKIGIKAMIIVHKEDLMVQWRKALIKFTDLRASDIGHVQGPMCKVVGKKIILGMIQSVCKDRYPNHIYNDIGICIWDECHLANADEFKKSIEVMPAAIRWGLSATTDRRDGKDIVFKSHIGPVKIKSKIKMLVPNVVIVKTQWEYPKYPGTNKRMAHAPGKGMHLFLDMANDRRRNVMIVKYLKAAYDKGRFAVFFSDLAVDNHLGRIKGLLKSTGVPPHEIAYYIGGMTERQRGIAVRKRIVLATCKMCDTGTDVPWWDFCLLGTPRADIRQLAGRVRREYPNKPTPIIIDLVDTADRQFFHYYLKRLRWYRSIGAEVNDKVLHGGK